MGWGHLKISPFLSLGPPSPPEGAERSEVYIYENFALAGLWLAARNLLAAVLCCVGCSDVFGASLRLDFRSSRCFVALGTLRHLVRLMILSLLLEVR